jgi:hypothetical protein
VLKCRDLAELVTPYLDGALPVRLHLSARLHLWLCGACRRYVAQVRATIRFLADGPRPSPAPGSEAKIIELLEAAKRDQ